MESYWQKDFANPSAIHKEGQQAREAVDKARLTIARILGVRENGIVFTSSGTESNDLAIRGVLDATGLAFSEPEIITTKTQHPSILETLRSLKKDGVKACYCPVKENGKLDQQAFKELLSKKTALVTLAYANSEVGTIEDIRKISRIINEFNQSNDTNILLHVDAAQAPLWLSCRLESLGADMLSLDAGKCYGPKGVGVLAFQHGVEFSGVIFGGGQEFGLRAGTENVAGIVGAGKALELATRDYKTRSVKVSKLRDKFIEALLDVDGIVLNGDREDRLANNVNISMPGIDSEFLVVSLDAAGIAASTKSACGGMKSGGSYVVREMTDDSDRANSTLRLSLGESTTKREVSKTLAIMIKMIKEHQKFHNKLS